MRTLMQSPHGVYGPGTIMGAGFLTVAGIGFARGALPSPTGSVPAATALHQPVAAPAPPSSGVGALDSRQSSAELTRPPASSPPHPAVSPGVDVVQPVRPRGSSAILKSAANDGSASPQGEHQVIYDSLCITDFQSYQNGFGATCGGQDVLEGEFDLQAADDFVLPQDSSIIEVVVDYVCFFGECPPAVCVQFYAADGCVPREEPTCSVTLQPDCQRYSDTIFSLDGVRMTVPLDGACALPAGRWFVSVQPRTTTDWFYQNMEYCPPYCAGDCECSAVVRDGGDDNPCCDGEPGFGSPDWGLYAEKEWVASMRITVDPGGLTACCFEDLTCEDLLPSECLLRGGRRFEQTTCRTFECPPKGACCLTDGSCVDEIEQDCFAHGGGWHEDQSCGTFECPPFGACCLSNGTCMFVDEQTCGLVGGSWHGGTECSSYDCTETAACCLGDAFCANLLEVECAAQGGTFVHDETCNLQCHGSHVRRLRAKCNDGGTIKANLVFKDHSADGFTAYLTIDGVRYGAGVVDRRAKLAITGFRGTHTVGVADPPSDLTVDVSCPP